MSNKTAANDNVKKAALTAEDAVDVWLRYWAGQFQHHIAAHYGVNPGRVSEVIKEKKHAGSRGAAAEKLKKQA